MFTYRVICRQSPEHIDVKDFKLLKYSQVACWHTQPIIREIASSILVLTTNMTQKQIKQRLEALEKTLNTQLTEGTKQGLERGTAYECGWYIGTIKQTIAELQTLQGK